MFLKMSKREFLKLAFLSSTFIFIGSKFMSANAKQNLIYSKEANQEKFPFELPQLPFGKTELEPHMSAATFDYHHGKHHQAYVTNLNKMIEGTHFASKSLEQIILESWGKEQGIFNNAAQIWNHTFFWHSMKPNGGGKPSGKVLDLINESFGSFEKFVEEFKAAATSQFGSGWAWLVLENGKLAVTKTSNAELPMLKGQIALLNCDVWEHAYYLDHQNRRPDYVTTFLEKLVNWDFAEKNLKLA